MKWFKFLQRIPQRYILGLMGFIGVINLYTLRQCLHVAIVVMVKNQAVTQVDPNGCPGELDDTPDVINVGEVYDWTEQTQGLILSSFFWGYVISHIPGGVIAHTQGGKQTVGLSVLGAGLLSLLIPTAATLGPYWIMGVRFLQGILQGATFPAINALLSKWVPPLERAKIGTLVMAGVQIGIIGANVISGYVIRGMERWDIVFYLFGLVTVAWYILWIFTVFNDPSSHPRITEDEKKYLEETLGYMEKKHKLVSTPWRDIMTSRPVIALIIGQIGHDWGIFTVQVDLPKYMSSVLKYPIVKNGLLSSAPFLAMWIVAMIAAWLGDYLLAKKKWSLRMARGVYASLASFGPAAGVVIASYAGCQEKVVISCFVIGMSLMGFYYPSLRVNALDIAPNNAAIVMAFVNGIGAISGIFSPMVTGFLTPNVALLEWRLTFWLNAVVLVLTNAIFLVFGSVDQEPWDSRKDRAMA